jgi:hypothetical protein
LTAVCAFGSSSVKRFSNGPTSVRPMSVITPTMTLSGFASSTLRRIPSTISATTIPTRIEMARAA